MEEAGFRDFEEMSSLKIPAILSLGITGNRISTESLRFAEFLSFEIMDPFFGSTLFLKFDSILRLEEHPLTSVG